MSPLKATRPFETRLSIIAGVLFVAALLTVTPAYAAIKYWSANGTTAGGDGTWNTTTLSRWAITSGGPWTLAWVNGSDIAENSSATANITLGGFTQKAGGSSTANSIEPGAGTCTLTLGITGNNTFSPYANDTTGRSLIINAAIAGAAGRNLLVDGPGTSGTDTLTLNQANNVAGNTTFSGPRARRSWFSDINWRNELTNAGTGGNLTLDVPINPAEPQMYLRFWVY